MSQNRAAGQVSNVMTLQDEVPLQAYLINLQDDAPNIVLGNLPDGRDEFLDCFLRISHRSEKRAFFLKEIDD